MPIFTKEGAEKTLVNLIPFNHSIKDLPIIQLP
jgi:hypothetical protein